MFTSRTNFMHPFHPRTAYRDDFPARFSVSGVQSVDVTCGKHLCTVEVEGEVAKYAKQRSFQKEQVVVASCCSFAGLLVASKERLGAFEDILEKWC